MHSALQNTTIYKDLVVQLQWLIGSKHYWAILRSDSGKNFSFNCSQLMIPWFLSFYLNTLTRFISCDKSVSVDVMLMVMCKNVAWLFQNALVLP